MAKKRSRPQAKRSNAWLKGNRDGFAAYNELVKHGTFAQQSAQGSKRVVDRFTDSRRFRVIKTADHSDRGYSWIVFDTISTNRFGEFTYIADCINAKSARLIADALNAFVLKKQ